jgi:UDP-N-acetyl-D-glucosamine/UDP-N-acetyl-D-galactosamine dehydrogenase
MQFQNKKICIIGLGYVGLPLAAAFSEKNKVIGFDINTSRISELSEGVDSTLELTKSHLLSLNDNLSLTSKIEDCADCNIYIITVPTPIDKFNKPDLTALISASLNVGSILTKDDTVIYESTVYPGVTEGICVPKLESSSNLVFNKDFYCGYSPERINPGDKKRTIKNIPKVTSGSSPLIAECVDQLYADIITAGTHLVSSIRVAEASKVIENIQRDVNIALINELALIFDRIDIDTNEVINAASTKWNFNKFSPGLVGGHCIGIDPYYLTYLAEAVDYSPDLILSARKINNSMSKFIADKTLEEITNCGKKANQSDVLILGVTFKENCPDMRNTKVIDVIEELKKSDINVDVYDPWVDISKESEWYKHGIIQDPLLSVKKYDAIIVAVSHDIFKEYKPIDYKKLSKDVEVIIDIKSIVENPTWRL